METDNREKQHILIVEDDRALSDGLCRALQNDGVETRRCHTLKEAESLLNGQPGFDLVILDVNLPDGNGFDFLSRIKEKYDIHVIMLTANDLEADIVAGLELGADDYMTKPFSLAVLRARVAAQLRRAGNPAGRVADGAAAGNPAGRVADGAAAGNPAGSAAGGAAAGNSAEHAADGLAEADWIADGDYRFHFAKMLFYHGEEQVELSKTEQKLLRFLVENKNITLGRERLLDCIWSVDAAFVDENTLSVTVKRLRDKLGAQDRIRTVYGIGYRWE